MSNRQRGINNRNEIDGYLSELNQIELENEVQDTAGVDLFVLKNARNH